MRLHKFLIAAIFFAVMMLPAVALASTGGAISDGAGWLGGALILGVAAAAAGARVDDDEERGSEPTGICAGCGMQNEADSKYCDQCGASMEAKALEDPDDDDPPSSKPASSSKPGASAAQLQPPARMTVDMTIAGIIGASSESLPAMKTAAIELRHIRDTAAAVTGKTDAGEIVGALLSMPSMLAAGRKAQADLQAGAIEAEKKERLELAHRLNKLGLDGYPRSSIFKDVIDETSGKRKTIGLRREYREIDLKVFRGKVTSLERNAPAARRDPFQPSRQEAEKAADAAAPKNDEPTKAQIEEAKGWPAVVRMSKLPGAKSIEEIAKRALIEKAKMMGGGR